MNRQDKKAREIPDPTQEPTLTVERTASILGIGRDTAYQCVKSGEIPSIRLKGAIRVPTAALARMLDLAPAGDSAAPTGHL